MEQFISDAIMSGVTMLTIIHGRGTGILRDAVNMDIGHRMKELRIQYGLTQQELADRAELTKGFISQLERNQNSPSVGTLLDIIQCLGMTPAEFFTDSEPEQIVYKANDYFEKIDEEKNSKVEWIIPNAQTRSMEPVRLTLHPGGSSEIYLPQECEEFGYVINLQRMPCSYGSAILQASDTSPAEALL